MSASFRINSEFKSDRSKRVLAPWISLVLGGGLCALLQACGSVPQPVVAPAAPPAMASPAAIVQPGSHWVAAQWSELPGWGADALHEAWQAALANCGKPPPSWRGLCAQIRQLTLADDVQKWAWLQDRFQPYRVQSPGGAVTGLLTGYYEPMLQATRLPDARHRYPLYQPPVAVAGRRPTPSRRDLDVQGEAAVGLSGRQIAYLADPVDALMIQIQGSTKLSILEPNGQRRWVRLAFAGTNEQPYQSVAKWLLERGEIRDASWPSIQAWVRTQERVQPEKVREMFWSNPRMVYFKEEALPADAPGPRGAQGVPLTAGRSIAVDKNSIPYGTPVWLVTPGPSIGLQRLVFAQDTGSAIVGAVRADYYVGSGEEAGRLAGKLKQHLQLWALWPRGSTP
jgi:membrane-bound lytic murein transglycosylase A